MKETLTRLDLAAAMIDTVPRFDSEAAELAKELYRQLAAGQPVATSGLAQSLGTSTERVEALLADEQLKGWTFFDDEGRVIGFRGLAVMPMPHQFEVDGVTLYTWCAMDSLFIPQILGRTAHVESADPHTGRTIRLAIGPGGVEAADPAGTVMSFVLGDPEVVRQDPVKVMSAFCHHIFFLESAEVGAEWADGRDSGAFIVSLTEAFELGRRLNANQNL